MLRPTNARNTMTFLTITTFNREPVAIETTGVTVYGKSTAPLFKLLSCLAKKLVDISGDPREWQWLHQRLSLAMVRGNTTSSILACVQLWSDFRHPPQSSLTSVPARHLHFINEQPLPPECLCFLWALLCSVRFFMLSVKPLCSIVLLPFSAILTNLILFNFHVPNTTVVYYSYCLLLNLLFVICLYLSV